MHISACSEGRIQQLSIGLQPFYFIVKRSIFNINMIFDVIIIAITLLLYNIMIPNISNYHYRHNDSVGVKAYKVLTDYNICIE